MRHWLFIFFALLLAFSASAMTRPTGYGYVPNYQPLPLANGADISLASAWRGRWADITGFYNIGLRPYDPASGRWLTFDSVWNERDPNYYTFAGGEPVNGFDPDGRCIEEASGVSGLLNQATGFFQQGQTQVGAISQFLQSPGQTANNLFNNLYNAVANPGQTFSSIGNYEATSAEAYWSSKVGLSDPSIAQNMEGQGMFQLGALLLTDDLGAGLDLEGGGANALTQTAEPVVNSSETVLPTAAEGGQGLTFYSVQSEADAARLAAGGEPWPTGLQRANLGEGLYAWGNQADAAAYAANKPSSVIMQFNMSASDYSSLNTLDMRTMSDEAATEWLNTYSQYGEGQAHGFDHIIRTTGSGTEYYFSPNAFQLFK